MRGTDSKILFVVLVAVACFYATIRTLLGKRKQVNSHGNFSKH